jgi:hypothetical protein
LIGSLFAVAGVEAEGYDSSASSCEGSNIEFPQHFITGGVPPIVYIIAYGRN